MLGIPAAIAFAAASADTPSADTSDWKCTQCPFLQGYTAEAEAGALGASGANATFRPLHRDRSQRCVCGCRRHPDKLRSDDGSYANYDLERLGLASRDGYVEGGREGRYDLRVSYDGQPTRLYDTAVTPFQANGSNLGLPADWVPAGSTGGMSALGAKSRTRRHRIRSAHRCVARLATSRVPAGRSSASSGARSMTAPGSRAPAF